MLIAKETPDSIYINDEIFNYLEGLSKTKNNAHGHGKKKFKRNDFDNDLETIQEDKKITKNIEIKGLDDNINNDNELKLKARKGLLFLLNGLSGGVFCPEIKKHFKKLRDEYETNKKASKKDNRKIIDVIINQGHKTIRRQNLIEKFEIKDLKVGDSIKDEDILKRNFKNNKDNKTLLNNGKGLHLTLKKKTKDKRKNDNNFVMRKNFKADIADKELQLFYSDEQIETGKKKLGKKKKQGIKKLNANNQQDSPITGNIKKTFKKSINNKNSIAASPGATLVNKKFMMKKTIIVDQEESVSITSQVLEN
jgi:hypothetical protein